MLFRAPYYRAFLPLRPLIKTRTCSLQCHVMLCHLSAARPPSHYDGEKPICDIVVDLALLLVVVSVDCMTLRGSQSHLLAIDRWRPVMNEITWPPISPSCSNFKAKGHLGDLKELIGCLHIVFI